MTTTNATTRRATNSRTIARSTVLRCCCAMMVLMVLVLPSVARAQAPTVLPGQGGNNKAQIEAALDGVGVVQRLGENIPLDLEFTDHNGNTVVLGDYFEDEKPVILVPVYYNCPMLCTLVLNGLMDALSQMEWSIGEEFRVVVFSFNPAETADVTTGKKKAYDGLYGRDFDSEEFPFLTGSAESITTLLDAIGYRIKIQPDGEIGHEASIVFVDPDGMIVQYMNDVLFQPRDVRLTLVKASNGEIGTFVDSVLLFTCFKFDPDSNSFVVSAWYLMRSAGLLTVLMLGGGLFFLFRRDAARRATDAPAVSDNLSSNNSLDSVSDGFQP